MTDNSEIVAARAQYEAAGLTGIVYLLDNLQPNTEGNDPRGEIISRVSRMTDEQAKQYDVLCAVFLSPHPPQGKSQMNKHEVREAVGKAWDDLVDGYPQFLPTNP